MLSFHVKFVQTDRRTDTRMDRRTDGQSDRQTTVKQYAPDLLIRGHENCIVMYCQTKPHAKHLICSNISV